MHEFTSSAVLARHWSMGVDGCLLKFIGLLWLTVTTDYKIDPIIWYTSEQIHGDAWLFIFVLHRAIWIIIRIITKKLPKNLNILPIQSKYSISGIAFQNTQVAIWTPSGYWRRCISEKKPEKLSDLHRSVKINTLGRSCCRHGEEQNILARKPSLSQIPSRSLVWRRACFTPNNETCSSQANLKKILIIFNS